MDPDLIEGLAEAVHAAIFADHAYHGVYQGDGGRQLTICTHCPPGRHLGPDEHLPSMNLPEYQMARTRATVRAVLRALDAAGLQIVQATSYTTRIDDEAATRA